MSARSRAQELRVHSLCSCDFSSTHLLGSTTLTQSTTMFLHAKVQHLLLVLVFSGVLTVLLGDSAVDECFTKPTLGEFVKCWTQFFVDKGSLSESEYRATLPTDQQVSDWKSIISDLTSFDGASTISSRCSSPLLSLSGLYSLRNFTDQYHNLQLCILYETAITANNTFAKGWGLLAVPKDSSWSRIQVHYSAAHPVTDGPVELQAAEIFIRTRGGSVLITGTRRDASDIDSECQPGNYRTDAAHNNGNMFHIALEAIFDVPSGAWWKSCSNCAMIQFHGKATTSCTNDSVFLSTGYSRVDATVYANANLQVNRLKDAWRRTAPANWTIRTPDESACSLSATTNIFGKLLNGVTAGTECKAKADPKFVSGVFIHAEQAMEAREEGAYDVWTKSILEAFPTAAAAPDFRGCKADIRENFQISSILFLCLLFSISV